MAKDLVMNIILKASDKASAAFAKLKQGSSGLSGALAQNQAELRKLEKAQAALSKHQGAADNLRRLSEELFQNSNRQRKLAAEIEKTGVATKKQAAEWKRLAAEGGKLEQALSRQEQEMESLNAAMKAAGVSSKNMKAAQADLAARHHTVAAAVDKQRNALEKLSRSQDKMRKAGVAAAAAGGAAVWLQSKAETGGRGAQHAVMSAMSEQDAMSGIIRQVGGLKNADGSLNHVEIAKMRAEIQALSGQLPMATVEIMQMYAAGAKMNVPRQELAAYVVEAVKAANAFEAADPAALAEELGRVRANFKLSKEAASELVNVLNYLDDNALVSGDQLISYMNEVSGSIGLAKIGDKHVAALGSALMSAGAEAGTAAKAVGSLITRLQSAPDTKPVSDALSRIGLNAKDVQKGMVTDAQATIEKIVNAVKKIPKEEQAGVLKGLAGGEYNRVFAGLIANTELWAEQIKLATSADALGSLDREFSVRVENMSAKWQMFKNKAFNTESGFGRDMFSALEQGMEVLGGLLDKYNTWAAKNPEAAAALAKVVLIAVVAAAAFAGLATALAGILVPLATARFLLSALLPMGAVGKVFGLVRLALSGLNVGLWGFAKTAAVFLFTNPFGWAILAVGLLVLLWRNWDRVKAAINAGWQYLKNILRDNPILGFLLGPIGVIGTLIANFDRLKKKAIEVKNAIANSGIGRAVGGAYNTVKGWVGFSRGGYTGPGGVNQAAGIVHKGEVVFSQSDVAKFGGWRAVEAIRRGGVSMLARAGERLRGFTGGSGMPALAGVVPVPKRGFAAAAGGASVNIGGDTVTINVHAAAGMSEQGIVDKIMSKLAEREAAKARRYNSRFSDKD